MGYPLRYILLPEHSTEAEVQFEAMRLLQLAGYIVRAEIPFQTRGQRPGIPNCRFDLFICDSSNIELLCIVECKTELATGYEAQVKRYEQQLPVPVLVCKGMQGTKTIVGRVETAILVHEKSTARAAGKGATIVPEDKRVGRYQQPDYGG